MSLLTRQDIDMLLIAALDESGFEEPLYSAVKYALTSGGKRLRPLMFLAAYCLDGREADECALEFAVGIELLHQYTLIHDDLPCMDNDDFRRGKPTCHKVFGEANALLAGDALLNLAFTYMLKAAKSNERAAVAAYEFSLLTGGAGVIGGQVTELNALSIESQLKDIYYKKTCCLIIASVKAGLIMSGADENTIKAMTSYCINFGMAFQLRDDLMDITEKGEVSEKSYVACFGVERTIEEIKKCTQNALDVLTTSGINSKFFTDLALKVAGRTE